MWNSSHHLSSASLSMQTVGASAAVAGERKVVIADNVCCGRCCASSCLMGVTHHASGALHIMPQGRYTSCFRQYISCLKGVTHRASGALHTMPQGRYTSCLRGVTHHARLRGVTHHASGTLHRTSLGKLAYRLQSCRSVLRLHNADAVFQQPQVCSSMTVGGS